MVNFFIETIYKRFESSITSLKLTVEEVEMGF